MEPKDWAKRILSEHPEVAEDLYPLIVWATSNREDPSHEAQLDEVEELIYAKTHDSNRHRDSHKRELLELFADSGQVISIGS